MENKKQFVNFLTCIFFHFAFNVIIFSYLVLFKRAENKLTSTRNGNFMKNNIPEKFSEISCS